MVVFRILGVVFLVIAGLALVEEIIIWRDTGELRAVALGELWFKWHRGSLNFLQAIIQRYVHPAIWEPGIVTVLTWRASLTLCLSGAGLVGLGWILPRLKERR